MMPPRSSEWIWLLGIFVLGLVLRIGFVLVCGSEEIIYDSNTDQYNYIDIATNLLQGNGYVSSNPMFTSVANEPTAVQPPVYPLFLYFCFAVFGPYLLSVRLAQAVLASLAVPLVWDIGRRIFNWRIGTLAALSMAVYPLWIMYARPIMTETPYTLLYAIVVWLWLMARDSGCWWVFAAWGAACGVAFLLRSEVAFLVAGVGIYILVVWLRECGPARRQLSINMAIFVVAGLVTITPWIVRNYIVFRAFVPSATKSGMNLWEQNWLRYKCEIEPEWCDVYLPEFQVFEHWDRLTELERNARLTNTAVSFIRQHPATFIEYSLKRIHTSYLIIPRELLPPPLGWNDRVSRLDDGAAADSLDDFPVYTFGIERVRIWLFRLLFLMAIAGTVILMWWRDWRATPLWIAIGANVLSAALLNAKERYRMPVDGYLALLASFFVCWLWAWLRAKGGSVGVHASSLEESAQG